MPSKNNDERVDLTGRTDSWTYHYREQELKAKKERREAILVWLANKIFAPVFVAGLVVMVSIFINSLFKDKPSNNSSLKNQQDQNNTNINSASSMHKQTSKEK